MRTSIRKRIDLTTEILPSSEGLNGRLPTASK